MVRWSLGLLAGTLYIEELMSLEKTHKARNRLKTESARSNYGFSEELPIDIEIGKLSGFNFIDDRRMMESDSDPGGVIRFMLAQMDSQALAMREATQGLVKSGIQMLDEATCVDLGESSELLAGMKPKLQKLLTACIEVVSGLQKIRNTLGYDTKGASVTTAPDEEDVQENLSKKISSGKTRSIVR